jgi:hypothetical protein
MSGPFRYEHEMTDLVERLIDRLTRRLPHYVLREVQAGQGTVDLLAIDFDVDTLSRRTSLGLGPITSPLRLAVLSQLQGTRWFSLDRLSQLVSSSPHALVRSTLRPLQEIGAIEFDSTRIRATGLWQPVAEHVDAVELKLSKWRRAARQADKAAWAADRSWIVLDRQRSGAALANRSYFAEFGVGFALVDASGFLDVVERPRPRRTIRWLRCLLGELAWARVRQPTRVS